MVVPSADGPETRMQLSAGEKGFLVATAADGSTHETDLSNCCSWPSKRALRRRGLPRNDLRKGFPLRSDLLEL